MFKKRIKRNLLSQGFTLIEIMIVIVIIAILAAVGIPKLSGTQEAARVGDAVTTLQTLYTAQARYCLERNCPPYPACAALDVTATPNPSNFKAAQCNAGTISVERATDAYTISVSPAGLYTCSGGCSATITRALPQ